MKGTSSGSTSDLPNEKKDFTACREVYRIIRFTTKAAWGPGILRIRKSDVVYNQERLLVPVKDNGRAIPNGITKEEGISRCRLCDYKSQQSGRKFGGGKPRRAGYKISSGLQRFSRRVCVKRRGLSDIQLIAESDLSETNNTFRQVYHCGKYRETFKKPVADTDANRTDL